MKVSDRAKLESFNPC